MATPFRTESKDKSSRKTQFVIIICSAIFLLIFYFWIVPLNSSSIVWLQGVNFSLNQGLRGSEENNQQPTYNKLLDGLLSPNFDEQSCQSRYQSSAHRKRSQHKPSEYLVSVLRNYEALHQRCGPNSELYRKAISGLKSGHSTSSMECNYLVWSPYHGLGNRMLTIASAFLYALLTKRVLLLHITDDMVDLFCEPFPGTTWVLPSDHFPIKDLEQFNVSSEQSYGNYLKNNSIRTDIKVMTSESLPAYVYLHLEHDYEHLDRLFFCDNDQQVLAKVNWLLIKSDMYFVPGLFFLSQFEDELRAMFPEREMVFHHLSRYLYHPTNSVWGMIMRYYRSYMANADEKIGIRVRTFWYLPISAEHFDIFTWI